MIAEAELATHLLRLPPSTERACWLQVVTWVAVASWSDVGGCAGDSGDGRASLTQVHSAQARKVLLFSCSHTYICVLEQENTYPQRHWLMVRCHPPSTPWPLGLVACWYYPLKIRSDISQ
jgi:hypothetical protein